jgi:hypothetical protein
VVELNIFLPALLLLIQFSFAFVDFLTIILVV